MSSCSIEAYDGNFGSVGFSSCTMRKARKQHKCDECGRIIHIGEQYEYAVGKYDGDFYSGKTCTDCLSLRKTFFCSWICQRIWDDFWEWLEDFWYNDTKELWKLENLTPIARAKVLEKIDEWEREDAEEQYYDGKYY